MKKITNVPLERLGLTRAFKERGCPQPKCGNERSRAQGEHGKKNEHAL
jgi:hypothetical protein